MDMLDYLVRKDADQTGPGAVCVSQDLYDEFIAEIQAMKPRKRKNWIRHLDDRAGQRTKCKFENGKIMNWSLIYKQWVEVIPMMQDAQKIVLSRLGELIKSGMPVDAAFEFEQHLNGTINANEGSRIRVVTL